MTSIRLPLHARGVGRDAENPKALSVYFDRTPDDDEMRSIHELLSGRAQGVFAWLVEDGSGRRYRTMEQGLIVWTDDPLKAIRFARRADAELFAAEDDQAWRIVEHGFIDVATPAVTVNQKEKSK